MRLLELDGVRKIYRRGSQVALDDVSFEIDGGEMVVVWGERRSGRSTLLRIAAGIETPDRGVVRFDGHDLARRGGRILGEEIGYCRRVFRRAQGQTVLDQLVAGSLARRLTQSVALANAWRALERAGAESCAERSVSELEMGEAVRVAIARALTAHPRLIVIDEPAIGVDPLDRDRVLGLLRSLADQGIAILASAGEGTGLFGAHRVLALEKGKLHGQLAPKLASVTSLSEISLRRPPGVIEVLELEGVVKHLPGCGGGGLCRRRSGPHVEPGEMLALLGPSGSGKTTLPHARPHRSSMPS